MDPIAGAYPAIRLGAPWWFVDSPVGMWRFRETATETAADLADNLPKLAYQRRARLERRSPRQ